MKHMLLARIDQPETPIKRVFNSHVDPYIIDATVSEGQDRGTHPYGRVGQTKSSIRSQHGRLNRQCVCARGAWDLIRVAGSPF